MTPEERFERIEANLAVVGERQAEMSARQQYHDEAFNRMDARLIKMDERWMQVVDAIERLANIAAFPRSAPRRTGRRRTTAPNSLKSPLPLPDEPVRRIVAAPSSVSIC